MSVRRLLTSYAVASVAIGLPWPLLLVLVFDRYGGGSGGAWVVGLAGAARMAPYVLLSWAVGSLGDRVRRDRLLRATMALRTVLLVGVAAAVAADRVGVAVVLAGLAVAVGTPAYPAIAASLPRLAHDRVRATEALVTIEVAAWVVGPALGGLFLATGFRPWTPLLAAVLATLGWALLPSGRIPGPEATAGDAGPAVAGMLRHLAQCRPALAALALAGVLNLGETMTGLTLLPLTRDGWHQGDSGFGLATACLGLGALAAPVLGRLVIGRRLFSSATRALALLGVAFAAVALTPLPVLALPVLAAAGAVSVVVETLLTGTLQDAVPDRFRAGALGVADTIMVGACLAGSLAALPFARLLGARAALVLIAVGCAVPLAAAVVVAVRRPRPAPYDAGDDRARPDPRGAPAVGATRLG